jgi:hypothetical protein
MVSYPSVLGIHFTKVDPTCRVRGHNRDTTCRGNLSEMDIQFRQLSNRQYSTSTFRLAGNDPPQ